jgi:hypothetical protein
MPKADKKTRGRMAISKPSKLNNPNPTHPHIKQVQNMEVNRGQSGSGGNKHRGDRRDMNSAYTGNARHAARGNTPRKNVATRKA